MNAATQHHLDKILEPLYRSHARSMDGGECLTSWSTCSCETAIRIRNLAGRYGTTGPVEARIAGLLEVLAPIAERVHASCKAAGFYNHPHTDEPLDPTDPYHVITKLSLIAGEEHEAVDAVRLPDWRTHPDAKVPEFSNFEIEQADALLRWLDVNHWLGTLPRVIAAVAAKDSFNSGARLAEGGKRWGKLC